MSLATGRPKHERLLAMRVMLWAASKPKLPTSGEISQRFGLSLISARRYRIDIVNATGMQRESDRLAAVAERDAMRGVM